jgi:diketogulonate reductase-like aldo/keto reductase
MKPKDNDGKMILENISIAETWAAMENLVKSGLAKSIGVANYSTMMLHDLLTYAKIKPTNNQIELHPYNSQNELINYCHEKDIVVTAYSPLGGIDRSTTNGPRLFSDETIKELSAKYGKSPSQILINWALSRNTIPIPKSVTPERITENIQVYDFELSGEDIVKINKLNKNIRFIDSSNWGIPYFS